MVTKENVVAGIEQAILEGLNDEEDAFNEDGEFLPEVRLMIADALYDVLQEYLDD